MTRKRNRTHPNDEARGVPTELLYGIQPEDAEEFRKAWLNSRYVADQIKQVIESKITDLLVDRFDDYNNPNWQIARADKNGQLRAFETIMKLLP